MYPTLSTYKTRRDREPRENWRRREETDLDPRNDIEKAVVDNHKEIEVYIKDKTDIPYEIAVTLYLQSRSYRHDVWVDFLSQNKASRDYVFNDVSVEIFHNKNYQRMVGDIPDNIKRLTPDILVRDSLTGTIILGDVTCTNYVRDASKRKHLKYKPIADFYNSKGIRVKHVDLIIDVNLSNLSSQLIALENAGLIKTAVGAKNRTIHYFRIANRDMENCRVYSSDKPGFDRLLKSADKDETEVHYTMELPKDVDIEELETWKVTKTQMELALEIKEAAEGLGEDYFDNDMNRVKEKLKDLREKNKLHEHTEPKSILKSVFNTMDVEKKSDHELIHDYIFDLLTIKDDVSDLIRNLLPNSGQNKLMKEIKDSKTSATKEHRSETNVYGPYQYKIDRRGTDNILITDMHDKLSYGKRKKNVKTSPKSIDPDRYDDCFQEVNKMISILGGRSNKPPVLNDEWDISSNLEAESSKETLESYMMAKSTNGAQLAQSMSMLYQRLCHLKTSLSTRDNIFVPPNGCFICIIPKDHAPVTSAKCNVPMIFLARCRNDSPNLSDFLTVNEYEYMVETEGYTYIMSKLCRLSIDIMANWDQSSFKLIGNTTYLHSQNKMVDIETICGTLALMSLDLHQKTSELLDLFKYVSFMPFADLTRLSKLIEDKFDIMIKTKLDAWTIKFIENLMEELSKREKLNAYKPKLHLHNGIALHDSFGMNLELPSIFNLNVRHKKPEHYIEEIAMIFIVRGKQLYGSQFMDKSATQTAQWEMDYREEVRKYGDWVINGKGEGKYPFDSKFAFSADAIIHGSELHRSKIVINKSRAMNDLGKQGYNEFLHYNCSLRGCVKEKEDRQTLTDLHTTSMEACLTEYEKNGFTQELCTNNEIAYKFLRSGKNMEFCMSEKEQRGGGRPIATPSILTKAALMMLEKPESCIGKQCPNNIIVPGKNKMKEICDTYKTFITNASIQNYKFVFQITEDQTKFSEMDNPRKFIPYIDMNENMDPNVRRVQKTVLKKILTREHLFKRLPDQILKTDKIITLNPDGNGVQTQIGWPQGMCNFMSTSIHMIADEWITEMYNLVYPDNKVITRGLVHSDDSWVVIACNDQKDFEMFLKFRIMAKKMFCLKMNEKKLWASRYLGELVSNYNINGNVHMSVAKIISNSFTGLNYINWVLDVHSQISTLQQCYRNGATIPTLIMMATLLRHQIMQSYHVVGTQKELMSVLPIELGGYPSNSVFELATTGALCHYQSLTNHIKRNPTAKESLITLRCLALSMWKIKNNDDNAVDGQLRRARVNKELFDNVTNDFGEEDYSEVRLPYRGDVFTCIKYLMPQSKKVKKTVTAIKRLPFETDQLELIITRPKTLSESLGHLKAQTSTLIYNLAAEKYTQSCRRLAISQSMQATGKVIKISGLKPMDMNEALDLLANAEHLLPATTEQLQIAFTDSNPVPSIAHAIVYNSTGEVSGDDKRKIINRLPEVDDNFKTMVKLRDVLLYIIDSRTGTKYYEEYKTRNEPAQLLEHESKTLQGRFESYFQCYNVKVACGLIMKLSMEVTKTRLWMQPYLNQETLTSFMEDLYGKTLDNTVNYVIRSYSQLNKVNTRDSDIVNTIYTTCVLNKLYEGKFKIKSIEGIDVVDHIDNIDIAKLDQDDLLKLAMADMELQNDPLLMRLFDRQKRFSKKYIKSQTYVDGSYVGDFIILARYGQAVIKVSGVVGNVSIEVNSCSHTNDILMAMKLLVSDSFPNDRYSSPTQWYQSEFWRNKLKIGRQFITSYSPSLTLITQTSTHNSIPIIRNDHLRFDESEQNVEECTYELDENMRVAFKVNDQARRIRIGNVKQALRCPLATKVECEFAFIEGFINNDLIQTKAIINMTLKRPFATPKKAIKRLLTGNDKCSDSSVVRMYRNILTNFADNIKPSDLDDMPQETHIIEYQISDVNVNAMAIAHDKASPETLESVQTNFILGEDETMEGSLIKYNNILRFLCKSLFPNENKESMSHFIRKVFSERYIISKIKEDVMDDEINEILDGMESTNDLTVSIETVAYIMSLEMDKISSWERVNIRQLLLESTNRDVAEVSKIQKLVLNDMAKLLFDKDVDEDRTELISMLKK